jgi:hypothetical protein
MKQPLAGLSTMLISEADELGTREYNEQKVNSLRKTRYGGFF